MYEMKPLLKKEADSTLKDMTLPTQKGICSALLQNYLFFHL